MKIVLYQFKRANSRKENKKMKEEMFKFPLPDGWQKEHKPKVEIAPYRPTDAFVRSLRQALGVSPSVFCEYLTYAYSPEYRKEPSYAVITVWRWEKGKSHPNYWLEERILKGFAWQIWSERGDTEEQMLKGCLWETSSFLNVHQGASL